MQQFLYHCLLFRVLCSGGFVSLIKVVGHNVDFFNCFFFFFFLLLLLVVTAMLLFFAFIGSKLGPLLQACHWSDKDTKQSGELERYFPLWKFSISCWRYGLPVTCWCGKTPLNTREQAEKLFSSPLVNHGWTERCRTEEMDLGAVSAPHETSNQSV